MLQPPGVSGHDQWCSRQLGRQPIAFTTDLHIAQDDGADQRSKVDRANAQEQVAAAHARDIHQVIDELHQTVGALFDTEQIAHRARFIQVAVL